MHVQLIRGDSGHPVLAMLPGGRLTLVAINTAPVVGTNYWSRSTRYAIDRAFLELEGAPLP
jgi:hypothetical protein